MIVKIRAVVYQFLSESFARLVKQRCFTVCCYYLLECSRRHYSSGLSSCLEPHSSWSLLLTLLFFFSVNTCPTYQEVITWHCFSVIRSFRLINHVNVVGCQTNLDVIAGVPYPNSFLHHLHDLPVRFYVHLSLGSDVRFCFELPKQKLLSKG